MMRVSMFLSALTVLAACGVDGEPIRPSMTTSVGVGSSGVNGSTTVKATKGNTSFEVGLGL